ncbi:MAG: hypothetical protein HY318_08435 [Armatimonadetes bacterium]|nr:hypothetical protein [Armatimonadota bacterium]
MNRYCLPVGTGLLIGGLVWFFVSPGGLNCPHPEKGPEFIAPDGRSAVWLRSNWWNTTFVEWRNGSGSKHAVKLGKTRGFVKDNATPPRTFVWFPESDRVFMGASSLSADWGLVIKVSTGQVRDPTKAERAWLLTRPELRDYDASLLRHSVPSPRTWPCPMVR